MAVRTWQALLLDAVLIVVFAAIGRANHGEAVSGMLGTAWPFLLGAGAGWLLVYQGSRRTAVEVGPGITVWACTLVVGMLLRAITGAGTAFSFVVVATLVLGVLLVGWRVGATVWARRATA